MSKDTLCFMSKDKSVVDLVQRKKEEEAAVIR